jgi:hypothetical protein
VYNGNLFVGKQGGSIEVGNATSANSYAYLDLTGDSTYTDYGLRLIRGNTGANTTNQLIARGTGGLFLTTQEAADLSLQTAGTTRMVVDSGGNIGIGTAAPTAPLHVFNNTVTDQIVFERTTAPAAKWSIGNSTINGTFVVGDLLSAKYPLRIDKSAPSYSLYIDSTGNVGIGTTSMPQQLTVAGNIRVLGTATSCTLGNGTGATNCSSDSRLKTNVVEISDALTKILQLRGVEFDWNEKARKPGAHGVGVIAQEIQSVFPTMVAEDENGYLGVDYAALVSPLIQSTKELYGMCKATDKQMLQIRDTVNQNSRDIASLQVENAELKSKTDRLEDENRRIRADYEDLKQRLEKLERTMGQ